MKRLLTFLLALPLFGAASMTFTNVAGTATNFPQQYGQPFVQGEIVTCPKAVFDGTPVTLSQADVKQRWPDGSVKHAIMAVIVPSVTAGAHTITYTAQACSNVALTKTQMLAVGFDFNAQIKLTNGSTLTADARTMLNAWDGTTQDGNIASPVQIWTAGPVATTVRLAIHGNALTCNAHPCSTYDVGFDANKSFRPIFDVTFWSTNQVHIRYIGENANTESIQNQTYSLALTSGSSFPVTVYTKPSFTHYSGTRWTKEFWINSAPPSTITINPNLTYLAQTKFLPNYNPAVTVASGTVTQTCANWTGASKDIGGTGNWQPAMGTGGARGDIGPYEDWVIQYLYTGDPCLKAAAFGNADLAASWPTHFREGKTGKILQRSDTPGSSTGLGLPISISGRPTLCLSPPNYGSTAADAITPVGTVNGSVWLWDPSHEPEPGSILYAISGDYWYLEEMMFWEASFAALDYVGAIQRGPTGDYGILDHNQIRAEAWAIRSRANLAYILPDSMAFKTYVTQLLVDGIAGEEGVRNITTTSNNATPPWNWGRQFASNTDPTSGAMGFGNLGVTPLHQWTRGSGAFNQSEYGICSNYGAGPFCPANTNAEATSQFEADYMLDSLGRCTELFPAICDTLRQWLGVWFTGMITNSGFNPYVADNGRAATVSRATGQYWPNYAGVLTGYQSTWTNRTSFGTLTDPDGYLAYFMSAASHLTGDANGAATWSFLQQHGMTNATYALNPKWAKIPRGAQSICLVSGSLPNGTVGTSYGTQTLSAQGCGASTLTWTISTGSLPPGLSGCSSTTGPSCSISGTPTTTSGSPFSFIVRVTDGASNTAFQSFTVTISPGGTPPAITSTSPLPNCTAGSACSFQFQATGTSPFNWSGGSSIPAGFTLSSAGLLSGTTSTLGTVTLTISVSNSAGSVGPVNFSLTVVAGGTGPAFTSTSPLPTGLVGTAYSNQIVVTGSPAPTCTVTGLPGWASLSLSCLLTGIPNAAGSSTIAVTASNGFGTPAVRNFTLPINQTPSFISTSPLPTATNSVAYSFQFQASGTPAPTYSATGVPTGLALSSGGLLNGTPTVNGTSNIAVTITNAAGSVGLVNFSITVNPAGTAPVITSTSPLPDAVVGQVYSSQFTGTGSSPPNWTATNLPSWASLTDAGRLFGTPDAVGTTIIQVTFANGFGSDGPKPFSLSVLSIPQIVTTSSQVPGGTTGTPFNFQFVVTGSPQPTCSAAGLPRWATLNAACQLTGTPTASGNTTFALSAANSVGVAGPVNFTLMITAAVVAPSITSTSPLTQATINTLYSFPLTATGSTPISWSLVSGSLPAGITLNGTTGLLSGTPTAAGTSAFTIRATNSLTSDQRTFNLTVALSPLDYTLSTTGPHHLGLGHFMYFNIVGTVTAGTDEPAATSISGLPVGVSAVFTNQIKFCCGATTPGINGLNLMQLTALPTTAPGTYSLTITYNSSTSHVIRTTSYSLIVDPLPNPLPAVTFPPNIPLTTLATYNSNMTSLGTVYCTPPLGGPAYEGGVWYYDGTRIYYQIADYTGNSGTWVPCALGLDTLYRNYALQSGAPWTGSAGNIPGYHVFPRGLQLGYTRDGVTADKTAIQAIQTNGYADPGNISPMVDWQLSRETSYGLETDLEAEKVGIARVANFQSVAEVLLGHMDQWFLSQTASYVQPFMVGLAAEALIQYWEATGDARVPPLLQLAANNIWSVSFDPLTNSMMYYNQGGTPASPYLTNCSDLPSTPPPGTPAAPCKGPSPDLNLLIAPLFGWVYQHTGNAVYRTNGDILFNNGVISGCPSCDGKHFSQSYRWSMKYIEWRASTTTGTCDLNSDSVVNVLDVRLITNMTLGSISCTANINGANVCNVTTIQRVVNSALGGACVLGP